MKSWTEVTPMETTSKQEKEFQSLTLCSICKRHFEEDDEKGSRQLYFTNKYRGPARAM